MAQQRRNRRKPRAINDHALVALHKYYLRAEYMRGLASATRDQIVAEYGAEALQTNGPRTAERFHLEMYIDYWYAGIFAVMEGTTSGNGAGPRIMVPVRKDVLIASGDQVAIDAVAAKIMGFDPMTIPYIKIAHDAGLGVGDPREIEIVGNQESP